MARKPRTAQPARSAPEALNRSRKAAGLMDELIEQIRGGHLAPGDLVMSGPALSKQYALSYQTVVRALNDLVERGWLVRQQGRGTFVAPHPPVEAEGDRSTADAPLRGRTVLLALDPQSLMQGKFGYPIVDALDEALAQAGLRVRYCPISRAGQSTLLEELDPAQGKSDADLLIAFDRPELLARALKRCPGLPALALHYEPDVPDGGRHFDAVMVQDRDGGQAAGAYLLAQGHTRLAHLGGPADDLRAHRRAEGFKAALAEQGLKVLAETRADGWDEASGRAAAVPLLDALDEAQKAGPLAVFCASDRLAGGLYDEATARGLKVPDDLSVLGFDDNDIAAQLDPALTTMRIDRVEYGRRAAAVALDRLAEPHRPAQRLEIPVTLLARGSVRVVEN